jgi:transposase
MAWLLWVNFVPRRLVRDVRAAPMNRHRWLEPLGQKVSTVATATSLRSPDLNPIGRPSARLKHLLRKFAARSAASQAAKSSEHLRPPNAPTISETQAMPNPKSIML